MKKLWNRKNKRNKRNKRRKAFGGLYVFVAKMINNLNKKIIIKKLRNLLQITKESCNIEERIQGKKKMKLIHLCWILKQGGIHLRRIIKYRKSFKIYKFLALATQQVYSKTVLETIALDKTDSVHLYHNNQVDWNINSIIIYNRKLNTNWMKFSF